MSLNIQTGSIQTTRILTSIAGDLPPLKPWQRENNKKQCWLLPWKVLKRWPRENNKCWLLPWKVLCCKLAASAVSLTDARPLARPSWAGAAWTAAAQLPGWPAAGPGCITNLAGLGTEFKKVNIAANQYPYRNRPTLKSFKWKLWCPTSILCIVFNTD